MSWHPSESDLALLRAGDLPAWKQYLLNRHLRTCLACAARADSYAELSADLRGLGQTVLQEPPWLAERIVAATRGPERLSEAAAGWRAAPAAALLVLVLLALLLVGQRTTLPRRLDYQASATPEAVVGEMVGPQGRQRVVLYTGTHSGLVEVSAGAGGLGISHADPNTGAVTITRLSVE